MVACSAAKRLGRANVRPAIARTARRTSAMALLVGGMSGEIPAARWRCCSIGGKAAASSNCDATAAVTWPSSGSCNVCFHQPGGTSNTSPASCSVSQQAPGTLHGPKASGFPQAVPPRSAATWQLPSDRKSASANGLSPGGKSRQRLRPVRSQFQPTHGGSRCKRHLAPRLPTNNHRREEGCKSWGSKSVRSLEKNAGASVSEARAGVSRTLPSSISRGRSEEAAAAAPRKRPRLPSADVDLPGLAQALSRSATPCTSH
mmetsp:Transcript_106971/g.300867  ORF Transcript_106971/g.300867 Transcript_106971/m.300867 type:complete len:259 (-) Transcript_106971:2881-3657(-)